MNQNRVNVYAFPHKGLRNALAQLSLSAGNTNYTDQEELNEVKRRTKELVLLLDLHAHSEEEVLLPALEKRVPNSTAHNHEEHEELEKEINAFDQMLDIITIASAPGEGAAFYFAFTTFHSKYIAHMAMEEGEINQLIWDNFTDGELMEMHGQIMGTLTPDQILMWFKFIVPALNPIERSIMMGGFKANAPAEFFMQVFKMLANEMSEKAHSQLWAMLTEPQLAN